MLDTNINTSMALTLEAGSGAGTTGAINFSTTKPITLQAASISLTADAAPTASDQAITVMATGGSLTLGSSMNSGTGVLTLTAVSGADDPDTANVVENAGNINLSGTAALTLAGSQVSVTSAAAPTDSTASTNAAALTITAAGDAVINAQLTTSGNLTITATDQLQLGTTAAVTLKGAAVTLTGANAPTTGSHAITVEASGELKVESNISTSGNITLTTSGALNFDTTKRIRVAGADISLTSGAAATASDQRAQIVASGNIDLGASLNSGTGLLIVSAPAGRIDLKGSAGTEIILKGGDVRITSDGRLTADAVVPSEPGGSTNAADLTLDGGRSVIVNARLRTSGNIVFTAGDNFRFATARARIAELDAQSIEISSPNAPRTGTGRIVIRATGDIRFGASVDAGNAALLIIAGRGTGTGKIDFIGTNAISLRGGSVRISSDRAASDPADAVMTPGMEAPALNKANVRIETAGNPVFNGQITTDGDITVTGGGQFRLARSQEVVLKGGNITLTASQPPLDGRHPITIEAKGNLNLNTGLDTSRALTLEAGAGASTGAISFDQGKATSLRGDAVSLTADAAPTASNQNLTISANGALTIATGLNSGSGVMVLEAGRAQTPASGATPQEIAATRADITFTSTPTITARGLTLRQDGSAFAATAPATFQNASGAALIPVIMFDGDGTQTDRTWASPPALSIVRTDGSNVTLTATGSGADDLGTIDAQGLLNLGSRSIYIETSGNIILPAGTTTMLARLVTTGDITLIAANIIVPATLTEISAANLSVLASGVIGRGTSLEALNVAFSFTASAALRLAGRITSSMDITLTGASAGAATDQDLRISTAGDIILASSLNQGTGLLDLRAGVGDDDPDTAECDGE